MAKTQILIVEDNIDEANYLRDALTMLDYSVSATVLSGEEALLRVSQVPPDLILMDIVLEGAMDGIETAEKIHADSAIPIIFLTAHDEEDFLQRAGKTEPFGFLLKPFSNRELRSTIEIALYKNIMEKKLKESEERYASIFNASTDTLVVTDRRMTVIDVNQRACLMYGYAREELLGRDFIELTAPACRRQLLTQLQQVLETRSECQQECLNLRRDAKEFHVEIQAAPFDYHGEPHVVSAVRDITERKQAEEALTRYRDRLEALVIERTAELSQTNTQLLKETAERQHSEEAFANEHNLLRTLIDHLPDYIFVKDLERRFILNNMAHVRLLGADSPDELQGKRDGDIFPDDVSEQYDSSDRDVLESGEALINREETTLDRQGRKQYLLTTKVPLRNRDDDIVGLIAVCRDITLRKHTELELRAHEELLRAALESTADGIVVIDKDGRITHLNDRFCEMWHSSRQVLEGQDESVLFKYAQPQLADPKGFRCAFQDLAQTDCKQSDIIFFNDGRVFERFSCPLIRAGEVAGRVWSFRDISEYKRVENELKTYREHLEELVEERTTELILEIRERKKTEVELHAMEQRYELAVGAANVGVWDWDLDRGRIYLEPNARQILGLDGGKALYDFQSWLAVVHPDDKARVLASAKAHIEGKTTSYRIEHRILLPDGRSRWISTQGKAFRNEEDETDRMLGTHSDISGHKEMEHSLQAVAQRLQTVIETVGDGITLSNNSGEFEIFNSEMEGLTGYSKEEANRSGDFLNLLYPEQEERSKAFLGLEEVRQKGRIRDRETTICSKDGVAKTLLVSSSIVASDDGESFLSAYHDITKRKHAERELQQAKDAAEAANRAKSEFLANMSHELRTPLNAILGYTQILRQGRNLSERQQYSVEVMQRSGEHLLMLINDILDLSKIEAQKLELNVGEFHVAAFLKNIVEMAEIRAQQKGIGFEYAPSAELPDGILADEKHLRQILLNLLSNGVKFTDSGKVRFRVSQKWREEQQVCIRFEVEDTGSGIAVENLHEIFLPFYQINKARAHTEGTGLGLAISQRLVQMMGGQLDVRSTPGKGSLFCFELTLPVLPGYSASQPQNAVREKPITGFKGAPVTVLIADDNDANRTLLKELLSPLGFQLIEAVDGVDTLQKAGENRPALILLDLIMPKLDGFEVVRQLRRSPELRDIVVLAVSASAFKETRQKSLEAGCDDFISKPLKLQELLEKLQNYLQLEWEYETPPVLDVRPLRGKVECYELPGQEDMQQLFELAVSGHIKKLLKRLESLRDSSPQTMPFLQEIQRMAQNFQMKQMCVFLQQYVNKG